jgi:hypothetical protein
MVHAYRVFGACSGAGANGLVTGKNGPVPFRDALVRSDGSLAELAHNLANREGSSVKRNIALVHSSGGSSRHNGGSSFFKIIFGCVGSTRRGCVPPIQKQRIQARRCFS